MDYLQWNTVIVRHFFNEEKAGKEVLLYVNKDLIEELGQPHGCGLSDFITAVKAGPGWTTRSGFCQMALQTCINWRDRSSTYPPYIAYLACFVLAAGTDMDVRAYAYYPRLRKILSLPDDARFPSFDRVHVLWDDLEKWTKEDKHEEWGRFVFGIRGNMIWVGLPRFQTLISAEERKNLALLFAEAELDPSDPPTQEILLKQLIKYGDHIFQRRTKEVLQASSGDMTLKEKLLEFVMDELEDWDGEIPEQALEGQGVYRIQSGLRLCMEIDPIAQHASFSLRLKTNRQFSGDELSFSSRNLKEKLICEDPGQGWSKVIKTENGERFNAAVLQWEKGLQLEDIINKWKSKMKAADVRLFVSGRNEGISDWIESQRLERGIPFKIAAYGLNIERIKSWGQPHCSNFRQLQVTGMPSGWALFEGSNATASCPGIDVLTLSSRARLAIQGGIKIRGGNTYLSISPPLVALQNSSGKEIPSINGKPLAKVSQEVNLWSLPEDVQINEILRIDVDVESKKITKILRLEEPLLANDYHPPKRDTAGNIIYTPCGSEVTFSGALAHIQNDNSVPTLDSIKPSNRRSIYFVGAPGQISEWPVEKMPTWSPLWALEKAGRREWSVTYCRKSLKDGDEDTSVQDKQFIKKWKELVWFNRKRINVPDMPLVKKKWMKYVEAARSV